MGIIIEAVRMGKAHFAVYDYRIERLYFFNELGDYRMRPWCNKPDNHYGLESWNTFRSRPGRTVVATIVE